MNFIAYTVPVQGKGGHWSVGTVLEEPALTDRNVYQQRLAKRRRKGPHNERQLLQEIQKLPEDIDRRQSLQQSDESAIQIMPEYQELQQQVCLHGNDCHDCIFLVR